MKLLDLLASYADAAERLEQGIGSRNVDAPVQATGESIGTSGTLHLSRWTVEGDSAGLAEDVPVTVVLPISEADTTEGAVVGRIDHTVVLQTFDPPPAGPATLVPDTAAWIHAVGARLRDMAMKPEAFTLGPAERLLPWLDHERPRDHTMPTSVALAAFQTIWATSLTERRAALATAASDLARTNKRILLICASHHGADEMTGVIGRVLRAAGLRYHSLLSRYELPVLREAAGLPLADLGFEAQMHQFYAQSRADKATLRRKYERFRELTPILAYKADKQKDLDEVKLLEWRLLTQITELQDKIKETEATLAEYESIPVWKRIAMQTVGRNVESLREYRTLYEQQIAKLKSETDTARARIAVLAPEAAIPADMRPEYDDLKEEVVKLGGTKKIRELLAAEEGTNRQAFIQNKRIVVTTAARAASDPLFRRVRFDAVLADEAPAIPAPLLLAAAGLAREKLVITGDPARIPPPAEWGELIPR